MSQPTLRPVVTAYRRALSSQFSFRILRMSFLPLFVALLIGFAILYFSYSPLMNAIQSMVDSYHLGSYLPQGLIKLFLVPLILMVLLLPLTFLIVTLIMNVVAMPAIVKHVSARQYPDLEEKKGGTVMGGLMLNLVTMLKFLPIWLVTLPLYVFPPLAVGVQVVLFGRLNARVMSYDALAEHASAEEFAAIIKRHAKDLTTIGVIAGACGSIPGMVWLGGALTFLFPVLVPLSIWLFIMVFIFTALWFQYYCMQALEELRAAQRGKDAVAVHA